MSGKSRVSLKITKYKFKRERDVSSDNMRPRYGFCREPSVSLCVLPRLCLCLCLFMSASVFVCFCVGCIPTLLSCSARLKGSSSIPESGVRMSDQVRVESYGLGSRESGVCGKSRDEKKKSD